MVSFHYNSKRHERQKIIDEVIGDGNIIEEFIVDRGHKNGAEIHTITDTGLIVIYNKFSGKMITKLIARPNQIKRYYEVLSRYPPLWLLRLAEYHKILGYNKL